VRGGSPDLTSSAQLALGNGIVNGTDAAAQAHDGEDSDGETLPGVSAKDGALDTPYKDGGQEKKKQVCMHVSTYRSIYVSVCLSID